VCHPLLACGAGVSKTDLFKDQACQKLASSDKTAVYHHKEGRECGRHKSLRLPPHPVDEFWTLNPGTQEGNCLVSREILNVQQQNEQQEVGCDSNLCVNMWERLPHFGAQHLSLRTSWELCLWPAFSASSMSPVLQLAYSFRCAVHETFVTRQRWMALSRLIKNYHWLTLSGHSTQLHNTTSVCPLVCLGRSEGLNELGEQGFIQGLEVIVLFCEGGSLLCLPFVRREEAARWLEKTLNAPSWAGGIKLDLDFHQILFFNESPRTQALRTTEKQCGISRNFDHLRSSFLAVSSETAQIVNYFFWV